MSRFVAAYGVAIALFFIAVAATADSVPERPKPKDIPLDRIWAYDMPGTRNIRDLDTKLDLKRLELNLKNKPPNERDRLLKAEMIRHSDVLKILQQLKRTPKPVGPVFIVEGTGKTALQNALKTFSERRKAGREVPIALPANNELSLVWFSEQCGHYIRLVEVKRSPETITVKYRFVVHHKAMMRPNLALIPVGKFPKGTYQVKVEQAPPIDELGRPIDKQPVCAISGSGAFDVHAD